MYINNNYSQILGSEWKHLSSGKVRELFAPKNVDLPILLVVSTDRISAFDHILSPEIPRKGEVLNEVTNFWMKNIEKDLNIPTHMISLDSVNSNIRSLSKSLSKLLPNAICERAILCKKLKMIEIECVVRGFLTGSAYKEYSQTGKYLDYELPKGLKDGDKLPEPIFTPAYKAGFGEHDENITFKKCIELVGEDVANDLRELSLKIFKYASETVEKVGITLVDTKFEFGFDLENGALTLGDEVLTPDSSRYLNEEGKSFDKQFVRSWLLNESGWNIDSKSNPPQLPDEIVNKTIELYREISAKFKNI